ncbi:MAG TPA: mannose-1-phosphate guanylyltransferase/mannose-6-phosphate isomerase [Pseudomonas sp.]|nr:mannose-1-phosphate guanylyltransferase/mannose-6-phosphate isomerase [Pseudomonas sp.]
MVPLILSGGFGTRLWPASRRRQPKQLLALVDDRTMFRATVDRVAGLPGVETPMVVCNQDHHFGIRRELDEAGYEGARMILEPVGRNTAPAVAAAALDLQAHERDPLLLVLPADHVIEDHKAFQRSLALATNAAENGGMVLFGIPATSPETGYGYIKCDHQGRNGLPEGVNRVTQFVEKPDEVRAQEYVDSGDYYWNSGMFLFRASVFLDELKKHDPDIYDTCWVALERSIKNGEELLIDPATFACCPDNSIDYAVMEKTELACVVPMSAGWSDVGSWSSLWDVLEKDENGNVTRGDVIVEDSRNCLVHGNGKLVTVVGLDNIVVVETKDATMIAHKDKVQDVKKLVNKLDAMKRSETQNHCAVYRPWGWYDSVDMGGRFQVKRICVNPGAQLSLQMHHHRAEHWIVVSGTAQVTCNDKTFLLTENQSTYIPVTSIHRLANPGKIPLEIIEVQSGSYLGEDDIERLDDVYGRAPNDLASQSAR